MPLSRVFSVAEVGENIAMMHHFVKVVIGIVLATVFSACFASSESDLKRSTFDYLNKIRAEKKEILSEQLETVFSRAQSVVNDAVLFENFQSLRKRVNTVKHPGITSNTLQLERHYVTRYRDFYDILFVNLDGFVFFTVKQETDFQDNLFTGGLAGTKLAVSLKSNSQAHFVDYDYYNPSGEAASFFVVPVVHKGEQLGWIVLQFSVNAISSVLNDYDGLGQTGEVYLVNRQRQMVTQSRFLPEKSSLQLKVDTLAPIMAMKQSDGNRLIQDYRGVRVFSSFERFRFLDIEWVIIVEIDEDEVITDFYRENKSQLMEKIFSSLDAGTVTAEAAFTVRSGARRVDINEYGRVDAGEMISASGVSTCTAMVLVSPNKFVYLGHIYPLDETYMSSFDNMLMKLGLSILGNSPVQVSGNLSEKLLYQLKWHDIVPAEQRNIRVTLAAVHSHGFERLIDVLLDAGFMASQIKILLGKDKIYLNVVANASRNRTRFEWVGGKSQRSVHTSDETTPTLADLVKTASGYQSTI